MELCVYHCATYYKNCFLFHTVLKWATLFPENIQVLPMEMLAAHLALSTLKYMAAGHVKHTFIQNISIFRTYLQHNWQNALPIKRQAQEKTTQAAGWKLSILEDIQKMKFSKYSTSWLVYK